MGVDGREEPQGSDGADQAPARQAPGIPAQGGSGDGAGVGVPQQRKGARRGAHARTDGGPREARGVSDAAAVPPPSDAELIARIREAQESGEGDGHDRGTAAYEELYRRHAAPVGGYARSCCRDVHTAEDLTHEVFARTLQAVRRGKGPDTAVRAYLLTTVRHVAAAWAKTARREQLVEDFAVFAVSAAGESTAEEGGAAAEGADVQAMRQAEASLAVQAFHSLPERWQMVLWHTTVEEESPSQVAPLLGLTANATAVLAHRAREGLKQAYLQAHVSASLTAGGSCAQYADRLGAYARGGLRMRAERGLRKHLEECARCRTAALELADVNARLRAVLPVAIIGWFTAGASVKAVAGAAGLAAGAAGAGSAAGSGAGASSGAGAASGAGAGGSGAGGASGGSAAAEGMSVPAKVGMAAGAVLAASAVIAYALAGDSPAPQPRKPQAKSAVAPAAPAPRPKPKPAAKSKPKPRPKPKPESVPVAVAAPAPEPKQEAPAPPPPPKPTPPPQPSPPPKPKPAPPRHQAAKPHKPSPRPTPRPPRLHSAVYLLGELPLEGIGDGTKPEVRITDGFLMWPRHQLRIHHTSYSHGVSAGASSSVTIDLNRPCTSFDAMVGVDDMTMGFGAVRFAVYADGIRLWSSGVVRGGDPALPVHVLLHGHKTLRLAVEPQSPFDGIAVVDWAKSRITCG